jgi:hypothetical protein
MLDAEVRRFFKNGDKKIKPVLVTGSLFQSFLLFNGKLGRTAIR